jgi:hypothetical protein
VSFVDCSYTVHVVNVISESNFKQDPAAETEGASRMWYRREEFLIIALRDLLMIRIWNKVRLLVPSWTFRSLQLCP